MKKGRRSQQILENIYILYSMHSHYPINASYESCTLNISLCFVLFCLILGSKWNGREKENSDKIEWGPQWQRFFRPRCNFNEKNEPFSTIDETQNHLTGGNVFCAIMHLIIVIITIIIIAAARLKWHQQTSYEEAQRNICVRKKKWEKTCVIQT